MNLEQVQKRSGDVVSFNKEKITEAIFKAADSVGGSDKQQAERLTENVINVLEQSFQEKTPTVEQIQDTVEKVLIETGHAKTAKAFILYRAQHEKQRTTSATQVQATSQSETDAEIEKMFAFQSKLYSLVPRQQVETYKRIFRQLRSWQNEGTVGMHPSNDYLGGNELADSIYKKKYYLKNLAGECIENRPEQVFARLASVLATVEETPELQDAWAKRFYNILNKGYFVPGGRVIAGAGDLYRTKSLANCFVSIVQKDNIESIYQTAYECARTYSYGGGIGVDISSLRPKDSIVHNAADKSTGAVSFMELYSLTTGLIGQSGRRGALMLTLDVKHPDTMHFINVKRVSNWVTKQIIEQCKWSNQFDEKQLREVERQVKENTQVRFANISMKVSDEFMQAVHEETTLGKNKFIVYKKKNKELVMTAPQTETYHYSYNMPSKDITQYEQLKLADTLEEINAFLQSENAQPITAAQLADPLTRDIFGDLVIQIADKEYDLAIKYAGDYMLYFGSKESGDIRHLIKARDIWDKFVAGNFKTAEPGLIFWTTMTRYSPSNYVGRPIASTNPCGEVPLEDGGACNLSSINLSRFVKEGYTPNAEIDWIELKKITKDCVRFLDNIISWNTALNPLEKQRKAAGITRRIGLGVIGIADMLNQLGVGYDSEEGMEILEKVMKEIANESYIASAEIAEEKGSFPAFNYEQYATCPFFKEALRPDVQEMVKEKGLRNVAILSIAPTGTISNIVLGFVDEKAGKNYIGVSGGIEPIFSLYYTRRAESFGNKLFKVFHNTVQAYIDVKGLREKVNEASNEDDLRKMLPAHFFRTAHALSPMARVKIQGIAQRFIDHSISSTVNLPESVDPETISDVYLEAWKQGLKGITIYRDGSRYPILSIDKQQSLFAKEKDKNYRVLVSGKEMFLKGDDVFALPSGKLSTPFHAAQLNLPDVIVAPVLVSKESVVIVEKKTGDDGNNKEDDSKKVCEIKIEHGKVVKTCSE
jgi:ribonucleoside-diphosphate reductase alpha chain